MAGKVPFERGHVAPEQCCVGSRYPNPVLAAPTFKITIVFGVVGVVGTRGWQCTCHTGHKALVVGVIQLPQHGGRRCKLQLLQWGRGRGWGSSTTAGNTIAGTKLGVHGTGDSVYSVVVRSSGQWCVVMHRKLNQFPFRVIQFGLQIGVHGLKK